MNDRPRVGIYAFSESRLREEVYQKRGPIAREVTAGIIEALRPHVEVVYPEPREIRTKQDVREATRAIVAAGVDCVLFLIPIWVVPSQVAMAGGFLRTPPLLLGNMRGDSVSQTGLLAAGGALTQAGIAHERILGDLAEADVLDRVLVYIRAATAVSRLRGQTFGCIGGRSLGITTGIADAAQWQRIFGVDIEHVDQSALIRIAEGIPQEQVEVHLEWIRRNFGRIEVDPSILARQVRSYLATKRIIADQELDFLGIKCQTDLSDWYCLQCLNVALVGDPYDAEGSKEPLACSCEADHDGALTMQIMKLLAGGKPVALTDIKHLGEEEMILANCGSSPTWFAAGATEPKKNLSRVHLLPHVFGKAGGASIQFVFGAGRVTMARLWREAGEYVMGVALGETVAKPREELKKTGWPLPHAFVRTGVDRRTFISTFGANHLHLVAGDIVAEIEAFCRIVGIRCRVY